MRRLKRRLWDCLCVYVKDVNVSLTTVQLQKAQEDFIRRLKQQDKLDPSPLSPLQQRINEIVQEFYNEDSVAGNGGSEVITAMCDWVIHNAPKKQFNNVREYMEYRWNDSAFL